MQKEMLSVSELAEYWGVKPETIRKRIKEMEKIKDRYSRSDITNDGTKYWISRLAYHDFLTHRTRLLEKNAKKYVPPFNPAEIATSLALGSKKSMDRQVIEEVVKREVAETLQKMFATVSEGAA